MKFCWRSGREQRPTDLVVVEVVQTLEGEVLLLDLLDHLLRQLLELSQRRHRLPPFSKQGDGVNLSDLPGSSRQKKKKSAGLSVKKDLHSLVNHLAKIHGLVGQLSPASVEHNLKDGSHQPASTLKNTQTQVFVKFAEKN